MRAERLNQRDFLDHYRSQIQRQSERLNQKVGVAGKEAREIEEKIKHEMLKAAKEKAVLR